MPNIHEQKSRISLRGIVSIKPDGGCNLSGHPRVSAKSEPESETNCRFSIRNNQTTVDKNGYNGIPFHFSGPKGRRFKSCHLDQKPVCIGWFFCTICTKSVDFSGLRRFPGETDCEGFCRILSDSDTVSGRPQPAGEIDRKWRKQAVAGSQE